MLIGNRQMIARRRMVFGLAAGSLIAPPSFAQRPRKLVRIGLLSLSSKKFFIDIGNQDSLLLGMREHGYEAGRSGWQRICAQPGTPRQEHDWTGDLACRDGR